MTTRANKGLVERAVGAAVSLALVFVVAYIAVILIRLLNAA